MRTVDDIRAVIYRREDAAEHIVGKFLALPDRHLVELAGDETEDYAVEQLREHGYRSKEILVLKRFRGRLFQACPCSPGMVRCGYHLVNTAFNCLYDCAYCFLNSYLNASGIVQFINAERALEELDAYAGDEPGRVIRVGTGEFTDSLMLDGTTGFSGACAALSARHRNLFLELKTKSACVGRLLDLAEWGNMVIAWSLNTPAHIARYESGAATLEERLDAAAAVSGAGYLTAFHFDPIIMEGEWPDAYRDVVDRLFRAVSPGRVAWISMGCFRYIPGFREAGRESAGARALVSAEMFPGPDGKYRYMQNRRVDAYRILLERIRRYGDPFVYLCMETDAVWRGVFNREFKAGDGTGPVFSANLMRRFM
jgi:spore photoproduct lyase